MKQNEVIVGCSYTTKINGLFTSVVVIGVIENKKKALKRFRVRKCGDTGEIPQTKVAASLNKRRDHDY